MSSPVRIVVSHRSAAALLVLAALVFHAVPLQAQVGITLLSNQGVIIADDLGTSVMIDGMVIEPYSVFGGLPEPLHADFLAAAGPFAGIDLALVSHQHHEHNQPAYACRFMEQSAGTRLITSAQVLDLMREKCRYFTVNSPRIEVIDPSHAEPEIIQVGGATVTVFPFSHGVGKYARLQNFGHLVEIGGLRILHLGDAAMDAADFERIGVEQMNVDVALIPYLYFHPGPGAAVINRFLNAPYQIAVHIPPKEMDQVRALLNQEFPRVLVLEHALDELRFGAPTMIAP